MATAVFVLAVTGHFAFLLYLTVGGLLALAWPATVWAHLTAAGWAVAITVAPALSCPLTAVERWARPRAGLDPLPADGFIAHYITGVWYPAHWEPAVQLAVAATVLGSWAVLLRRRSGRGRAAVAAPTRPRILK